MRAVIIGGTGRVGTYLTPRMVEAGYETIVVSRGKRCPLKAHGAWKAVSQVSIDRKAHEVRGTFGEKIASLKPDIVVDMMCFAPESAQQLMDALQEAVQHVLVCSTHWVYGHSTIVPNDETTPHQPICEYGIGKARMGEVLMRKARTHGFPATVILSGHIVCPGDIPVNPAGNKDPQVFGRLARGERVVIPNNGMETLHHVHADDLAQGFMNAIAHRSVAVGEYFNIMSPAAVTFRGYAEAVASWFGRSAQLEYRPWEQWKHDFDPEWVDQTWQHLFHSPNQSIEKAKRLLGYQPRYSSLQALRESVMWLKDNGVGDT